jgi:tetraacyldisaccharide 4'-kinase
MTMQASLRSFIEARWYGEKGVFLPFVPLSWLFALLAGLRRGLYRVGLLSSPELPVPVIVVGNINVGGTGKTPIVAWFAQQLIAAGHRPGIVSRGYGAVSSKQPKLVLSDDTGEYGDEPVLLATLAGCPVCVCIDRVAAVKRVAEEGVTIVISDDGLQHYRMRRVMEIVVVDAARGFGNGHLLPAGPLRESVSRAYKADALVINGEPSPLSGYNFKLEQQGAVCLASGKRRPLNSFAGQRVWAVAGIGNPDRFFSQLMAEGIETDEVPLPDHGAISIQTLLRRKDQPVLMTEKDAVKYTGQSLQNVWYVPVVAVCSAQSAQSLLGILQERLESDESRSADTV